MTNISGVQFSNNNEAELDGSEAAIWTHNGTEKDTEGKISLFHLLIMLIPIRKKSNLIADRIRYLTMTDASRVWMPDTFFRKENIGSFHTFLQPNLYIRIFPDGTILYSIRLVILE